MKKLLICLIISALTACTNHHVSSDADECFVDLDSLLTRGTIRVVTDYNTINYFVHKDIAVGYQYELVNEYAAHAGLKVELKVSNDNEQNILDLQRGRVDLIVTTLIADTIGEPRLSFTEPYGRSWQVLVHHADAQHRTDLRQFAADTISVLAGSFYEHTLQHYNDTTDTVPLVINPIEHYDVEQILQLVAEREIKQALSLEMIVRANRWYYPNLDYSMAVGPEFDLAWAVRHSSEKLKTDIDQWLRQFKQTPRFKQIFRKYVIDPREHHSNIQSTSYATYKADFQDIIQRHATDERYNWILISSIVYQESHFNPSARSWAGASGLMQLMPETAQRFGVDDVSDPEQNIEAGIRYLLWLDNRFATYVPDPNERIKFTLASYNVGLGHIMDAIRLAEKIGLDPKTWYGNVEVALLHKVSPSYYTDPVVRHGYCHGTETINYVRSIIERYKNYRAHLQ